MKTRSGVLILTKKEREALEKAKVGKVSKLAIEVIDFILHITE